MNGATPYAPELHGADLSAQENLRPPALMAVIRVPPPVSEFCNKCGRTTLTAVVALRCGRIGNLCSSCRSQRRGRPYLASVPRSYFNPTPHGAGTAAGQGGTHEPSPSK